MSDAELREWGTDKAYLPILDAIKGTRDWRDAISTALRRGGENLGLLDTAEIKKLRQDAKSVVPGIADPAKEALTAHAMSSFGPGNIGGPALAGAIRAGGRPNLYALHATSVADLRPAGPGQPPRQYPLVPRQLTSPSFSIKNYGADAVNEHIPFGDFGVLLAPRVGAVDPKHLPGTIYNTDAFTGSTDYRFGGRLPNDKWDTSSQKFKHGMAGDLIYDEGSAHAAAIMQSPEFRSAKAFEEHPLGARILQNDKASMMDNMNDAGMKWQEASDRWGLKDPANNDAWYEGMDNRETMKRVKEAAAAGDQHARDIIARMERIPSDYAELKVRGNMGVTPERFAGVVLNEKSLEPPAYATSEHWKNNVIGAGDFWSGLKDAYVKELRQRKIPFEFAGHTDTDAVQAFKHLVDTAAPFGGR